MSDDMNQDVDVLIVLLVPTSSKQSKDGRSSAVAYRARYRGRDANDQT